MMKEVCSARDLWPLAFASGSGRSSNISRRFEKCRIMRDGVLVPRWNSIPRRLAVALRIHRTCRHGTRPLLCVRMRSAMPSSSSPDNDYHWMDKSSVRDGPSDDGGGGDDDDEGSRTRDLSEMLSTLR